MIVLWLVFALLSPGMPQTNLASDPQLPVPQQCHLEDEARRQAEAHRQAAIQMNELAGRIQSEADARQIADAIAKMFDEYLPPPWATHSLPNRIARAEYDAVSDPSRLIPEQRIADVWNEYVREIDAPDEALVTSAEIHSLRDGDYASAQMMWTRVGQSIWTMPNLYAAGSDGKVANGCRAFEALRVVYDLSNMFWNVRAARERLQKGIVASNQIGRSKSWTGKVTARLEASVIDNPIRPAESRHIREQGMVRFNLLLESLSDKLFPPE
jgi:hypothetical protein